jgi:hypothetical protein
MDHFSCVEQPLRRDDEFAKAKNSTEGFSLRIDVSSGEVTGRSLSLDTEDHPQQGSRGKHLAVFPQASHHGSEQDGRDEERLQRHSEPQASDRSQRAEQHSSQKVAGQDLIQDEQEHTPDHQNRDQ